MAWYNNVYRLGIQRIDFGNEFPIHERFEYVILTYDKQRNEGEIPGHFDSLLGDGGVRESVKRLSGIVKENTSRDCEVDYTPKIFILDDLSEDRLDKLKIRKRDKIQKMGIKKGLSRLRQRELSGSPGGNPNSDFR